MSDTKTLRQKLLDVQSEIEAVKKEETNPFFNSKYFDINGLLRSVKPVLNKHGLVVLQPLAEVNGAPAIRTIIMDSDSDETIESITPITNIPDAQKMGSAVTYFRRYSLQSMLALEAEDDDAEGAMGRTARMSAKPGRNKPGMSSPSNPDEPPF